MERGVVKVQARRHHRIGTGLKVQIDDLLQRLAEANRYIGRRGNRRKIDVQRFRRLDGWKAERLAKLIRGLRQDFLERGIERIRHERLLRRPLHAIIASVTLRFEYTFCTSS
jgi:hypothetical protein